MFVANVSVSGSGQFFAETFPLIVDGKAEFAVGAFPTYFDALVASESAAFDEIVCSAFAGRPVTAKPSVEAL